MAMILPGRDYCFWFNDLVPDGSECLTTIHGRVVAIPGRQEPPAPDWRNGAGVSDISTWPRTMPKAGDRSEDRAPTVPNRREVETSRAS